MKKRKTIGFYLASSWLALVIFMAVVGPFLPLPSWNESFYDYLGAAPGTPGHLLGTTQDGYDMLSGIVNGARLSIAIAFVAVVLGGGIGSFIGITTAYFRGRVDTLVVSIFNILLSIPNLVLSLALLSVLAYSDADNPTTTTRRVLVLILSLTIVIVPILGRIARSSTLQWAGRDFVLASKSMGSKNFTIIRRAHPPERGPGDPRHRLPRHRLGDHRGGLSLDPRHRHPRRCVVGIHARERPRQHRLQPARGVHAVAVHRLHGHLQQLVR